MNGTKCKECDDTGYCVRGLHPTIIGERCNQYTSCTEAREKNPRYEVGTNNADGVDPMKVPPTLYELLETRLLPLLEGQQREFAQLAGRIRRAIRIEKPSGELTQCYSRTGLEKFIEQHFPDLTLIPKGETVSPHKHVRLLVEVIDDGQDHHPRAVLGRVGDVVEVRQIRSMYVGHKGVPNSFILHEWEWEPITAEIKQ